MRAYLLLLTCGAPTCRQPLPVSRAHSSLLLLTFGAVRLLAAGCGLLLARILLRVHELVDNLPLMTARIVEVGVLLSLLLGPLFACVHRTEKN